VRSSSGKTAPAGDATVDPLESVTFGSCTSALALSRANRGPAQRVSAGHEDSVIFGSAELNG